MAEQSSADDTFTTRRATVPALEAVLGDRIDVLDHGFVRVVDYMGDDAAIVQAARVSYGKGTKKLSQDRGLIRYLMRHRHTTPFEMCELKLHVKLPIFVARQWIRHRTANVNEYSARYSILDREFYLPELEHLAAQSATNKQGRGEALAAEDAQAHRDRIGDVSTDCYAAYEDLLNLDSDGDEREDGRPGIARELARMVLPTNYYTQWYWKVDLHNLLHFLSLRADPHAQYEIRVYADVICDLVKQWVPLTWEAFEDYRRDGAFLSGHELDVVRALLSDTQLQRGQLAALSKRERGEFLAKLGLEPPDTER